jgi:adenylate kinase family enzyme
MPRILIFGNSGSGKTSMARDLARERRLAHLDLDTLAWDAPGVRSPLDRSTSAIQEFLAAHEHWVIEGCYGDLLEATLGDATEIRFLNPGTERCILNCRSRPWEPHKYASREDQDANLEFLIDWVRQYEVRTDEFSLTRHREIFDRFPGPKAEIG